jgi:hypothetical protein
LPNAFAVSFFRPDVVGRITNARLIDLRHEREKDHDETVRHVGFSGWFRGLRCRPAVRLWPMVASQYRRTGPAPVITGRALVLASVSAAAASVEAWAEVSVLELASESKRRTLHGLPPSSQ